MYTHGGGGGGRTFSEYKSIGSFFGLNSFFPPFTPTRGASPPLRRFFFFERREGESVRPRRCGSPASGEGVGRRTEEEVSLSAEY